MKLKELRTERGLLQREIAHALNIAPTTYLSYEKGINEPSNTMLCRLADFFDVSVDELLGRTTMPTLFDDARIERPKILDLYDSLTPELQKHALAYLHGLADRATIQKTATFNVSVNEIRGIKQ